MTCSAEDMIHIPVLNMIRKNVTRFVWHTPNGGSRRITEAMHLKDLGTRAGVPDLTFVVDGLAYFLEIKAPKGRVDPKQLTFGREAQEAGARWAVVYSKEQAIEVLTGWGLVERGFAA